MHIWKSIRRRFLLKTCVRNLTVKGRISVDGGMRKENNSALNIHFILHTHNCVHNAKLIF